MVHSILSSRESLAGIQCQMQRSARLLMQALMESDRNPFSELAKGQILEFVRLAEEKPVERKSASL